PTFRLLGVLANGTCNEACREKGCSWALSLVEFDNPSAGSLSRKGPRVEVRDGGPVGALISKEGPECTGDEMNRNRDTINQAPLGSFLTGGPECKDKLIAESSCSKRKKKEY
ncbi:hypothetical protein Ancab_038117, partial [Ancistrocladus abbreviatus]